MYVSEMEWIEHTWLLGMLSKLKEESVVTIENEDDVKMIDRIVEGLKTK